MVPRGGEEVARARRCLTVDTGECELVSPSGGGEVGEQNFCD